MDANALFDMGTIMTGLVLAAAVVFMGVVAPGVRAMATWVAAAFLCEAATGSVTVLQGAAQTEAGTFLLAALHGLVPGFILVGLRTLAPTTMPPGLPTTLIAGMLVWLGVSMSAEMDLSWVLAPVHGFRAVLFLLCGWVLWRGLGAAGRPALAISLASAVVALLGAGLFMMDGAWIGVLREVEEALTFGMGLGVAWLVVRSPAGAKAAPAGLAEPCGGHAPLDFVEHGLLGIDEGGRLAWTNLYARRLLADGRDDALVGKPWTDFFPSMAAVPNALNSIPMRDILPDIGKEEGLGLVARSLDGRAIPVTLVRPVPAVQGAPHGGVGTVVLVRAQGAANPTNLARLSLQIDSLLIEGETPETLCTHVSRRVAELESAALVWIALGPWKDSLTLSAAGGPAMAMVSSLTGKPLGTAFLDLIEPALAAGRPRIVAGGIPVGPDGAPLDAGTAATADRAARAALPAAPVSTDGIGQETSIGLFPILGGDQIMGIMVVHGDNAGVSNAMIARCDVVARRLGMALRIGQDTAFLRLQAAAMSVAANAIFITDHDGRIEWVNEAFVRLSGFSAKELKGKTPHILFSGQQDDAVYADLWNTIRRGNVWRGELVERRKDGSLYTVQQTITPMRGPDDGSHHYVAVHEDITDRKRAEERIRYLSNYDTLTRLPNRTLFRDRLNQAVQQAHWTGGTVAVLFMDLTQFSRVNDTLGHDVGDQILMTVGSRINAAVAEDVDVVARMGGDEFALVQGGHNGTEAAAGLARRLGRIIEAPVEIGDRSVSLRATIGIAMYPEDGTNPDSLIKNADLAMHRVSRAEGEAYCFFSTEMNNEAQTRLNLEGDLRRALERDELVNFYQPQYDMNGSLVGMEALVRWRHPTRGLVPPGDFIPAAEDSGLIAPLGDCVLQNAVNDMARWRGLGLPAVPVAVNISAVQFRDPGLLDRILSVLETHGLGPDALDLELTESILMGEQAGAVAFLNRLAAEGFRIAIDDFGTGYSSLSYLKRFPVHKLKIDQSFVQHLQEDTNDAILVRAIINLGHSLAMTVVAEGVETEEQFSYLRNEGADVVQGYLFSKPVPSDEMETLLRVESGRLAPASPI